MMRKRVSLVLIPLLLLLAGCINAELPAEPVVGNPAPDFTLTDMDGNAYTLSELGGQAVLLNFWATWCAPCRFEMPLLDAVNEQHGGDLIVLAINLDEPEEAVRAFRDEMGLALPLLLDPGGLVNQLYQVRGYPTSVFIDGEGLIQAIHIGEMNENQVNDYLAALGIPTE